MPASRRALARDGSLLAFGAAGLLALFAPRSAAPPDASASLWASGHTPGAALLGLACALLAALGLLGLLGDSPLELRADEREEPPPRAPWWRRPSALLAVFLLGVSLCTAGSFGLWDPWETHYGEVAREMLSRDDWLTLWWGPEGWFLSKPALLPALAALGMSAGTALGVDFRPGVHPWGLEWCVRLPVVLLAACTVLAVGRTVGALWSRRAGLYSALVLCTAPFWVLLSHQAMTDLPFVATMTLAMLSLARAVSAEPEATVRARALRVGPLALRLSRWHLTVGLLVVLALPQALYLLTRPVLLACPEDAGSACELALRAARLGPVQLPVERFFAGSAGNSAPPGLPSVPGAHAWTSRFSAAPVPSFAQGLLWLGLLALVLRALRRDRNAQSLHFTLAWCFSGLSFLAKGPAGVGVPELALALFLLGGRRWELLRRLRLARGVAVFLLVGAPWYAAVSCRLGREFFDRFVLHDLLARTLSGVHGEQGGAGYYLQQLAVGLFPWSALLPAALLAPPSAQGVPSREALRSLARAWFGLTLALFSAMATRFHHYIFPAIPAAAILLGCALAEHSERAPAPRARLGLLAALSASALTLALAWELAAAPERALHLFTYNYAREVPALVASHAPAVRVLGVCAALCLALLGARSLRRHAAAGLGLTAAAGSLALLLLWFPALSQHRSQRALFDRYLALRDRADAPLGAYALNWKGEGFYSGGAVAQFDCGFPSCSSGAFERWLAEHARARAYVLTEHSRVPSVRALAERSHRAVRALTDRDTNLYFTLLEVLP